MLSSQKINKNASLIAAHELFTTSYNIHLTSNNQPVAPPSTFAAIFWAQLVVTSAFCVNPEFGLVVGVVGFPR